jgi:rhamnose transport system permease protein
MMDSPLRWAIRHLRETSVAFAYFALLATLFFVRRDFYTTGQFWKTLVYSAPTLVAAVGMTLVIIARQIDISIGWQLSVAAVTAGLLAQSGVPLPLVVAAGIAVGAAIGAVNGALVAALKLPSIVVTLATMVILRESLGWIRGGEQVRNLSEQLEWFRAGQQAGEWLIVAVAAAVWLAGLVALRYLPAGRAVYATGSDEEAARLAGIRPQRVTFHVFVLMGALAGFAALLKAAQEATIEPVLGRDFEFQAIAAVVVGGVAISGGRGNLIGSLLGVLLLGTISSAFLFLGIDVAWEKALEGAIILLAVAIDALDRRSR